MLVLWCKPFIHSLIPCSGSSFPKKVVLLCLGLATHFLILARIPVVSPAKRVICLSVPFSVSDRRDGHHFVLREVHPAA